MDLLNTRRFVRAFVAGVVGVTTMASPAGAAGHDGLSARAVTASAAELSCSVSPTGPPVTVTISPSSDSAVLFVVTRKEANGYSLERLGTTTETTFEPWLTVGDGQVIQVYEGYADGSASGYVICGVVDVGPAMSCSVSASGSQVTVTASVPTAVVTKYSVSRKAQNGYHYRFQVQASYGRPGTTESATIVFQMEDGAGQVIQLAASYGKGGSSGHVVCGEVDVSRLPEELSCAVSALGPQVKVAISPSSGSPVRFAVSRKYRNRYAYLYLGATSQTTFVKALGAGERQVIQVREIFADGSRSPNTICGEVDI